MDGPAVRVPVRDAVGCGVRSKMALKVAAWCQGSRPARGGEVDGQNGKTYL